MHQIKLAPNRAVFYSEHVSGTSFLIVCHPHNLSVSNLLAEDYQNCSVLYCVLQAYTVLSTHIWAAFAGVLGPAGLGLDVLFGFFVLFCVFFLPGVSLFILCFSVFWHSVFSCFFLSCQYQCKWLCWRTHLWNDLLYVKRDVKLCLLTCCDAFVAAVSREIYWVRYHQTPVSVRRQRCQMKPINKWLTFYSLSSQRVADHRLPVLCLWKSWQLPCMVALFTVKWRWAFWLQISQFPSNCRISLFYF